MPCATRLYTLPILTSLPHRYKLRPFYADGTPVIHSDNQLLPVLHEIYSLVYELHDEREPIPDLELIIQSDDCAPRSQPLTGSACRAVAPLTHVRWRPRAAQTAGPASPTASCCRC